MPVFSHRKELAITTTPPIAEVTNDVAALFTEVRSEVAAVSSSVDWAEDEISRAVARHPAASDVLYHTFALLRPRDIGPGMHTELVYRGHVRELLDRVAADGDPRIATAAEICLACSQISLSAPLHGAAAGLYFRMWLQAFPEYPVTKNQPDDQIHYETLFGSRIDELESLLRCQLTDPDRHLGDVVCPGRHHGEAVACRYATQNGDAKTAAKAVPASSLTQHRAPHT